MPCHWVIPDILLEHFIYPPVSPLPIFIFFFISLMTILHIMYLFTCLLLASLHVGMKDPWVNGILFSMKHPEDLEQGLTQRRHEIHIKWKKEEMNNWGDGAIPFCSSLCYFILAPWQLKNNLLLPLHMLQMVLYHWNKNLLKQTFSKSLNYMLISLLATQKENYYKWYMAF